VILCDRTVSLGATQQHSFCSGPMAWHRELSKQHYILVHYDHSDQGLSLSCKIYIVPKYQLGHYISSWILIHK